MANAPKTARKRPATGKRTKASTQADNIADEAADAAAVAAKAAEDAAAKEKADAAKAELLKAISVDVEAIRVTDSKGVLETRERWAHMGGLLREGKALFTVKGSNECNDKEYGAWLKGAGYTELGQRAVRAAAIKLSEIKDLNPDLYNLIPTEKTAVSPKVLRTPRAVEGWIRDQVYIAFNLAKENASLEPVKGLKEVNEEGKEVSVNTSNLLEMAQARLPVVEEVLDDTLERRKEAVAEFNGAAFAKCKNEAEKTAYRENEEAAANNLQEIETAIAVFNANTSEAIASYFVNWKPREAPKKFEEKTVDEAADTVVALVATHPQAKTVLDVAKINLDHKLRDKLTRAAADDGDVDPDADDEGDLDGLDADDIEEAEDSEDWGDAGDDEDWGEEGEGDTRAA